MKSKIAKYVDNDLNNEIIELIRDSEWDLKTTISYIKELYAIKEAEDNKEVYTIGTQFYMSDLGSWQVNDEGYADKKYIILDYDKDIYTVQSIKDGVKLRIDEEVMTPIMKKLPIYKFVYVAWDGSGVDILHF